MAAYSFSAYNSEGKRQSGVIEADSERGARSLLRARGLFPESLADVSAPTQQSGDSSGGILNTLKNFRSWGRKKISPADLTLLTRQLATLLAAGIPIDESLSSVVEQSESQSVKLVLLGVRSKVLAGHGLAESMQRFPGAFPKIYIVTVRSGEQSGHLDVALLQLADYTEKQHAIRRKVKQALIYPSMMAFVASSVIVFLIQFVVPKIVSIFQDSDMALPGPTIFMLGISNFLQHYGLYLLLIILVMITVFRKLLQKKSVRRAFDRFLLKLPVIGRTMLVINCARFSRTFGILMQSSVPVLDALNHSAELISPLPMREAVLSSVDLVREGGSIHDALRKTGYFPPMFLHLLASGEKSGNLELMLGKIADNQDKEVESVLQSVLTLFEPIMILVMGGAVLFIVLAVLMPIFSMNQMMG